MIKVRKNILILALLLLLFNTPYFINTANSEEISVDQLPNATKTISLKLKDKPLSIALANLAYKAKINIAISPDFNDTNISINSNKISVGSAFETLKEIGNLTFENNNGVILIKNSEKESISTVVINVKNVSVEKLAYIVDKTVAKNDINRINIDKFSNSIIIQGDKEYISQIQSLTDKLDLPKKHSSFKLNHYTSCQVANILEHMIFKKSESSNDSSSRFLAPVFDKDLGYVIKALIQKNDQVELNVEMPIIIPENTGNEITVIGNDHQVLLVKELVEYLEGKKEDKDEEIRSAHNKLFQSKMELKETKSQLEQTKLELADVIVNQVNTEVELKKAKKEITALNDELNQIKSDKSWQLFFNYSSNNQSNYIKELENEIANLKNEINKGRNLLSHDANSSDETKIKVIELSELNEELQIKIIDKQKINNQLQNELIEKENQLAVANDNLIDIKAKLAEMELKKDLTNNTSNEESNFAVIASTLEDLQKTKTELNKVKAQLEVSKQQLELIFGGKLLDNSTMPNEKSLWFN